MTSTDRAEQIGGIDLGPQAGRAPEILRAFTHRVAEVGYDAANFSDVAAQVGVSKGLIAHHFGSKERMLALVHAAYMRRRLRDQEALRALFDRPREQLAGLLHAVVWYQVHDRDDTVAFQREIVRLMAGEGMAEGHALRERYLETIRQILRAGSADGDFRRIDLDLTPLLLMGSAQWMWTWFDPDGRVPAAKVGAALADLALGGLLAEEHLGDLPALRDPNGRVARHTRALITRLGATA